MRPVEPGPAMRSAPPPAPIRGRAKLRHRLRPHSRRPRSVRVRRRPRSRSNVETAPPQTSPQAPGVRGFRDIAADADDLGRAAAQASRAARKTYANVPSPSPEFDRLPAGMEDRGFDSEAPYSYDESVEEAERYAPSQQPRPRPAQDRE